MSEKRFVVAFAEGEFEEAREMPTYDQAMAYATGVVAGERAGEVARVQAWMSGVQKDAG